MVRTLEKNVFYKKKINKKVSVLNENIFVLA